MVCSPKATSFSYHSTFLPPFLYFFLRFLTSSHLSVHTSIQPTRQSTKHPSSHPPLFLSVLQHLHSIRLKATNSPSVQPPFHPIFVPSFHTSTALTYQPTIHPSFCTSISRSNHPTFNTDTLHTGYILSTFSLYLIKRGTQGEALRS